MLPSSLAGKTIIVNGATSCSKEKWRNNWHGAPVYPASQNESKASVIIEPIRAKNSSSHGNLFALRCGVNSWTV